MKKFFLIGSALVLFGAYGCEKCKDCTTTTTTTVSVPVPGYPQTTTTTFEACGDELKDVDGKVITSKTTVQGITATATARTVCK